MAKKKCFFCGNPVICYGYLNPGRGELFYGCKDCGHYHYDKKEQVYVKGGKISIGPVALRILKDSSNSKFFGKLNDYEDYQKRLKEAIATQR